MRLIVLAAGAFAVPMLRALATCRHEVVEVICRPERGRRGDPQLPAADCAQQLGLPLWRPDTINAPESVERLREQGADLQVVCDYGEILRPPVISSTRLGGVNLHGSLLPRHRGAAPVQYAVWQGDEEAGVTVIQVARGLDSGPMFGQKRLAVLPDETAGELEARLAELGAGLMVEVVDQIAGGVAHPTPQDPKLATKAPRLSKEDGEIDWRRSAGEIKNQVRAMQPWPRTFTYWSRGGGEPLRLNIDRVSLADASGPPGLVVEAGDRLVVAAGQGALEVLEMQAPGKRRMTPAEFLRGASLREGATLVCAPPPAAG